MKFGFRKPSWKKSLSAATRGAVTRAVKKAIIPGYGEKGMGVLSPKKYFYNRVYNMTTVDTLDLLKNKSTSIGRGTPLKNSSTSTKKARCYESEQRAIFLRKKGLAQFDVVTKFVSRCRELSFESEAIKKVEGRASKYLNKGVMCGVDLYDFAKSDFEELIKSAIKLNTVNECQIAISIIEQLNEGKDFDDIISNIKVAYLELSQVTKPNEKRKTIPDELLTNPNGEEESRAQHAILMDFIKYSQDREYGLFIIGAKIKLLEYCGKRHPSNINLFDFARFKLNEKIESVKKAQTRAEYYLACDIIDMLEKNTPKEQICRVLDDVNSKAY